jgi:hypothetical protein
MTDTNSAPVSLPAGSFDYDDLKGGLDKAAKGSAKNYDAAVEKAIEDSSAKVFEPSDARAQPGFVYKDVERKDLGVTETIQVYDPKLGEKLEAADPIPGMAIEQTAIAAPADGAAPKE